MHQGEDRKAVYRTYVGVPPLPVDHMMFMDYMVTVWKNAVQVCTTLLSWPVILGYRFAYTAVVLARRMHMSKSASRSNYTKKPKTEQHVAHPIKKV